jgi:hypothetical protein
MPPVTPLIDDGAQRPSNRSTPREMLLGLRMMRPPHVGKNQGDGPTRH